MIEGLSVICIRLMESKDGRQTLMKRKRGESDYGDQGGRKEFGEGVKMVGYNWVNEWMSEWVRNVVAESVS